MSSTTLATLRIGEFELIRVADIERQAMPTGRGFPDLTRDMLQGYLRRFGPTMIDPDTLDLVLSFHSWVLRRGDQVLLVDCCLGDDKERPTRPKWHRRRGGFLQRLAAAGVNPGDVNAVMCTHLHSDHVGWNTRLVDGRWVPTFPNARYIMAETEYLHWRERAARDPMVNNGSYADSVLPVVESGQAELVAMNHRVATGVHFEPAPGHTPGTVLIHVEDGGQHGVCTGDILHHPFQLDCPEMLSGYCDDPAMSARSRVALCERYADTPSRLLTAHFPDPSSGFIRRDGKRFRFEFDPN
jgi:glyoxylase-like metal-dependent hydrolase (beta-lactamase superfamily II)